MIIIFKFQGGLGNQLFQIAFFNKISKKFDKKDKIFVDLSSYSKLNKTVTNRDFLLTNALPKNIIFFNNFFYIYFFKIIKKVFPKNFICNECDFNQSLKFVYFDGYWQNIENILLQKKNLLQILKKNSNTSFQQKKYSNCIFVHFRFGDYLSDKKINKKYGVLKKNYYLSAINKLKNKLDGKSLFLISTDDYDFFKDNYLLLFKQFNYEYLTSNNLFEILSIQAHCRVSIIANSTFSLIGSLLSDSQIIFYPKELINQFESRASFPKKWINF
jgi:hypothetical protein